MGIFGSTTIEDYIRNRFEDIGSCNNADHKATFQPQLDDEEKRCRTLYERGQEFVSKIPQEDLARCRRLYESEKSNGYGADHLIEERMGDKWMILPRYASLIGKVRKLREVLA